MDQMNMKGKQRHCGLDNERNGCKFGCLSEVNVFLILVGRKNNSQKWGCAPFDSHRGESNQINFLINKKRLLGVTTKFMQVLRITTW